MKRKKFWPSAFTWNFSICFDTQHSCILPLLSKPVWSPWALDTHSTVQTPLSSAGTLFSAAFPGCWFINTREEAWECQSLEWAITYFFWYGDPTVSISDLCLFPHIHPHLNPLAVLKYIYIKTPLCYFCFIPFLPPHEPIRFFKYFDLKKKYENLFITVWSHLLLHNAEISLWNVPSEHFCSYVLNSTPIAFYTLHSILSLAPLSFISSLFL